MLRESAGEVVCAKLHDKLRTFLIHVVFLAVNRVG